MEDKKSKTEIDTEQTKGKIEKVTKKRFSDFFKSFWKAVDLGKKRGQ